MSSCAKATLSTAADTDLLEHTDVINEDVEQSQFLTEAHQYKETTGVECHTVGLFLELLPHIQGPEQTDRHTDRQVERLTYKTSCTVHSIIHYYCRAVFDMKLNVLTLECVRMYVRTYMCTICFVCYSH